MNIVYYARFCQLIFSYCFPDVPMPENGNELPFRITKRAFPDLIKKDSKKPNVPVFAVPVTVQDKLRVAMPDRYEPLFSDENIPHPPSSSAQPVVEPTSGPVVTTSPKRILRSSKSPTKPSPPPRKRRFLQKISDSDSDEAPQLPPPVKKQRKKVKPTNITDLTVEPPQSEDPNQALILFSDQPQSADPVMIEPLSAMPLDTAAADIQMSDTNPDFQGQSEDAQTEAVLKMIQDSLIQPEANVAAPVQEVSTAANSDAATEALASHTLSIFVDNDDDDATEVTSIPVQTSESPVSVSDPVRDTAPTKVDSPVLALSPVRESSPLKTPTPNHTSPIQHSMSAQRRVCHLTYFQRMCRAQPPSVEDRLTSIEATQRSMQHTLVDLSSYVEQLKKSDDDEEGNEEAADGNSNKQLVQIRERSDKGANSERLKEFQQKHRSMEMINTQIQSINEAVRVSEIISKELAVVNSEVEQKKEGLIPESDKLIEAGGPESQKFCQTLKFREEEEAGLTRTRKNEVKPISDITLTSDSAQVKVPATEEKPEN
nr:PREDICTED: uncharacterized protein LOC108204077 [Daucus carota subsp. sativus]